MCLVNKGHCKGYAGAARIASLFLKLLLVATLRLDKIQDSQSISGQSNCAMCRAKVLCTKVLCTKVLCTKQLCKVIVQSKGIVHKVIMHMVATMRRDQIQDSQCQSCLKTYIGLE